MTDKYQCNNGRKSSSATIVPPPEINSHSNNNLKLSLPPLKINTNTNPTSVTLNHITTSCKPIHYLQKILERLKNKRSTELYKQEQTTQNSFHDLSPGSTAIEDEEGQCDRYYTTASPITPQKRTLKAWTTAVLMIIIGIFIGVTFVFMGLGKAMISEEEQTTNSSTSTTLTASSKTLASVSATATVTVTITSLMTSTIYAVET
ncbi:uncharacterized protein B0P05DRAFT_561714 [Gilbertella persicaria]|uniref:Uncharacterized protein n=1 Tax=Rhizopus stolonifer TaxID=4846 RepID=A0A367KU22_RHIST|nr:uncharacterized protein B0P05DRAFT_561714 [Gilbertella persicaria]KAI8053131.1 hypothetical protein B0P05DRAFT_561714 [Gilbertella persicaria]RCI05362.1 hypothetical protein CU098_013189 [Rhizopus stolonifer]